MILHTKLGKVLNVIIINDVLACLKVIVLMKKVAQTLGLLSSQESHFQWKVLDIQFDFQF